MKVILTGATGFVGGEVLKQLITNPKIERITCLVRREIKVQSPKCRQILINDFNTYDAALAADLATHNGCIWTLGGKASDLGIQEFEKITTGFTLSLVNAIGPELTQPFRFCYLSGMGADPTESAILPWEKLTRHMKGRTERHLREAVVSQPFFSATAFRPAGILPLDTNPYIYRIISPIAIRVDELARSMISEIERNYSERYRVLENSKIKSLS